MANIESNRPDAAPSPPSASLKGKMNIRCITLQPNSMVYFKRLVDNAQERVTMIDRRIADGEYTTILDTPLGVYVERTGFLWKLILWHNIADIDFLGSPPDYGIANPATPTPAPVPTPTPAPVAPVATPASSASASRPAVPAR